MASLVVPAVLASDIDSYERDLETALIVSDRLQIDITDGVFAPSLTINLEQAHWPDGAEVDLHLMLQKPEEQYQVAMSLRPSLIIIHVEADGDLVMIINEIQSAGIKAGVALLPGSKVSTYSEIIAIVDHVLIFSGTLGSYGGQTDMEVLSKVPEIHEINPSAEIGIDGGVNIENIAEIAEAGIDVCNVGSAIQQSDDPEEAYATLVREAQEG